MNINAQDALTADIMYPTFNQNCQNGKIDLHINGGFAPYDVVWYKVIWNFPNNVEWVVQSNYGIQGNNDGEDLMNVMSGFYRVEVTDALCGTVSKSFKIRCVCSDDCSIIGEIRDVTCDRKGRIEVDIECEESGHGPLTYEWNDGITWKNRTNLDPGTYCLTVTDVDGCTFDKCFEVGGDEVLQVEVVGKQNNYLCSNFGDSCDGSIDIEVVGGGGGYTYKWSNGATTQDISGLCPKSYTVTVTDNNGCESVVTVDICCCEEEVISGQNEWQGPGDCYSNNHVSKIEIDGQAHSGYYYPYIETDVSGGTGDYICVWTGPNGFTSYDCWGLGGPLEPGEYCLTVDDGCDEEKECFTIVDCEKQNINVNANIEETCDGVAAGSISLSISGGSSPYEVEWDNGMSGQSINGLGEGEYCAEITDANGCESGPHCFDVGSKQGEVTTSTIPCTRTVTCNGIDYVEYFGYEQTLDCNILYSYCPATGETVVQDLGWFDVYVSNCNVYGICQTGQHILLETGWQEYGPFSVEAPGCPYNIGCTDYACYIPGIGYVLDEGSQIYCSTVYYTPDPRCGKDQCWAQVYCGSSFVAEGCADYDCNFFDLQDNDINLAKELNIPSMHYTTDQLLEIVASDQFKNRNDEVSNRSLDKIDIKFNDSQKLSVLIYPNPSNGKISLKFNESIENLSLNVFDVMGRVVYNSNYSKSIKHIDLDLNTLVSGVYFVHLVDSLGKLSVERIVIE